MASARCEAAPLCVADGDAVSAREWCHVCLSGERVVRGRLIAHVASWSDLSRCLGSGEIPWRRGTPTAEVVRAHLREGTSDHDIALFDVRCATIHARVSASLVGERVLCIVVLPPSEDGRPITLHPVDVPSPGSPRDAWWWWRPVSLAAGAPRRRP